MNDNAEKPAAEEHPWEENGFEFANAEIAGAFCPMPWPAILQRPPGWQWKAPSGRPRRKRKKWGISACGARRKGYFTARLKDGPDDVNIVTLAERGSGRPPTAIGNWSTVGNCDAVSSTHGRGLRSSAGLPPNR